ncbi:major capsid protein [Faustovirus]|nr:major capsid protein [Faustovirus]
MSAGGVFKLIANDGKADRMIMANDLLNDRIKSIMCLRAKQGFSDPTPDIERTHILLINSHYKPFAAMGEYQKTRPNTGNPTYNSTIQFSIPQFGDFFSDMVVQLAATSASAGTVPALPAYIGATDQATTSTTVTSSTQNTTSGLYTLYTQSYVNQQGTTQTVGAAATNFVRYCEYPGLRLFRRVKFEVDEYTALAAIMYNKFHVPDFKLTGWKRLVGQEVPVEASSDLVNIAGTTQWGSPIVALSDVNGTAVTGSPVNAAITARKLTQVVFGAQTPKATQPQLNMFVPLLFWFRDPRLAIASVSIPGQRFITVDIEQQSNMLFVAPGNLTTVETLLTTGAGKGTATGVLLTQYNRYQTYTPQLASGSAIDGTQAVQNIELYINNIFVTPEIHDIYIKRIGFTLIRVYREQVQREVNASDQVLQSQLKWPVEFIYLGLRPANNVASGNLYQWRDWHHLTSVTNETVYDVSQSYARVSIDDTVAPVGSATYKQSASQVQAGRYTVPVETETIDTVRVKAHGIELYAQYAAQFYRDYIPWNYGSFNLVTPQDKGALFLNFCLYPGTYQPGHVNISRAREFYIEYVSSCDSSNPCDLISIAKCINFLLISDGSAVKMNDGNRKLKRVLFPSYLYKPSQRLQIARRLNCGKLLRACYTTLHLATDVNTIGEKSIGMVKINKIGLSAAKLSHDIFRSMRRRSRDYNASVLSAFAETRLRYSPSRPKGVQKVEWLSIRALLNGKMASLLDIGFRPIVVYHPIVSQNNQKIKQIRISRLQLKLIF